MVELRKYHRTLVHNAEHIRDSAVRHASRTVKRHQQNLKDLIRLNHKNKGKEPSQVDKGNVWAGMPGLLQQAQARHRLRSVRTLLSVLCRLQEQCQSVGYTVSAMQAGRFQDAGIRVLRLRFKV